MKITKIETFVGIDPGSGGGVAFYGNGRIHAVKMPKELSELQNYLRYIRDTFPNVVVFVENVQAWQSDDDAGGKKYGINKMLKSLNQITSTLTLIDMVFVPVYPVSWQSTCGLRIRGLKETQSEKKNRFKSYVENCFPEIPWTLATADAGCLVQFGLMKYENEPDWIWPKMENNHPPRLL